MVYGAILEGSCGGNSTVGSNPIPSVFIPTDNCAGGIFCRKPRVCSGCIFPSSLGIRDSLGIFPKRLDFIRFYLGKFNKNLNSQTAQISHLIPL